jgi:hypothetical protein
MLYFQIEETVVLNIQMENCCRAVSVVGVDGHPRIAAKGQQISSRALPSLTLHSGPISSPWYLKLGPSHWGSPPKVPATETKLPATIDKRLDQAAQVNTVQAEKSVNG